MEIRIGRNYETEFASVFRLVSECRAAFSPRDGYGTEGRLEDVELGRPGAVIRKGTSSYIYSPDITNARFLDDDDDQTVDEEGFGKDGASWFRALRGDTGAISADAEWIRLMEEVARQYHRTFSIVEYKQRRTQMIGRERAFAITKRLLGLLFGEGVIGDADFVEPNEDGETESVVNIYGLSLRLSLSGGTGESERVLGKVYFSDEGRRGRHGFSLEALTEQDASGVHKMLSDFDEGDDSDWCSMSAEALEMLKSNALGGLRRLIESSQDGEGSAFVRCLICDDSDRATICDMLERTAHNVSELQCDELRVLGISHVQWRTSVFDCVIDGERKLRVSFGMNDSINIRCLNCGAADSILVKNNSILIKCEDGTTGSVYVRRPEEDGLGLSEGELELVRSRGVYLSHLRSVSCKRFGEECRRMRCENQLFTPEGGDRQLCKSCYHPDVVYTDIISGASMPTTEMCYAHNVGSMVRRTDTHKCGICKRMIVGDEGLCPICSEANELRADPLKYPERASEARALYRRYAEMMGVFRRLVTPMRSKYCFEDSGMIVFVMGKRIYTLDKLSITQTGVIDNPKHR